MTRFTGRTGPWLGMYVGLRLGVLGCSGTSHRVTGTVHPAGGSGTDTPVPAAGALGLDGGAGDGGALDASTGIAVRSDAGVVSGEIAWLVTHLADDPDPARGGDSDATRRLAAAGPEGIHAVAEVFRVGDPRRVPFARRVIERAALGHCHRDRVAAGWLIARLQQGATAAHPDADAGIVWAGHDDLRWSSEAVARMHHWADQGLPCDPPDGGST